MVDQSSRWTNSAIAFGLAGVVLGCGFGVCCGGIGAWLMDRGDIQKSALPASPPPPSLKPLVEIVPPPSDSNATLGTTIAELEKAFDENGCRFEKTVVGAAVGYADQQTQRSVFVQTENGEVLSVSYDLRREPLSKSDLELQRADMRAILQAVADGWESQGLEWIEFHRPRLRLSQEFSARIEHSGIVLKMVSGIDRFQIYITPHGR